MPLVTMVHGLAFEPTYFNTKCFCSAHLWLVLWRVRGILIANLKVMIQVWCDVSLMCLGILYIKIYDQMLVMNLCFSQKKNPGFNHSFLFCIVIIVNTTCTHAHVYARMHALTQIVCAQLFELVLLLLVCMPFSF